MVDIFLLMKCLPFFLLKIHRYTIPTDKTEYLIFTTNVFFNVPQWEVYQ